MRKRLTQEDFENRSNKIHGFGEFDFLEKYKISSKPILMKHNKCGYEFFQRPGDHLQGKGCAKCAGIIKLTQEDFENRSNLIHGFKEFDYTESKINGSTNYVLIIHNKCKTRFKQIPHHHMRGIGCPKCSNNAILTQENFEEKSNKIHGFGEFDYIESKINGSKNHIWITHTKCGTKFQQTPNNHMRGKGCPNCVCSKIEQQINYLLKQNNIKFETQKRFNVCKNKNPLPFDFYLTDYNILIEYDGEQHFKPHSFGIDKTVEIKQKNLVDVQFRDSIKTNWAKEKNIPLIRISYKEQHLIEEKINKLIKFLKTNII